VAKPIKVLVVVYHDQELTPGQEAALNARFKAEDGWGKWVRLSVLHNLSASQQRSVAWDNALEALVFAAPALVMLKDASERDHFPTFLLVKQEDESGSELLGDQWEVLD
jgi:hypothetical protein